MENETVRLSGLILSLTALNFVSCQLCSHEKPKIILDITKVNFMSKMQQLI